MSKSKSYKHVASSKTSILVIEKGNLVSKQILNSIKDIMLSSSIKLHKGNINSKIKNHDIYVINCNELSQDEQIKTIRKLYKSNSCATLFCIGDNFNKDRIEKESKKFMYPINIIETFTKIIDHISCIENIKQKISNMWHNLEKA